MSLNGQNLDHSSWGPSMANKFMTGAEYAQKQVIDHFKKQGLDVVKLMKDVDDSPPQNPIDALRQEIIFQGCVVDLMQLFAYDYDAKSNSWWAGNEMTIVTAVKSGRKEAMEILSAYANETEWLEEDIFDQMRESEGAVKSLAHLLNVLEEQALAHDAINSKHPQGQVFYSVPSEMFPGFSYYKPNVSKPLPGQKLGDWKKIVLRELPEGSSAKQTVLTLDELRAE